MSDLIERLLLPISADQPCGPDLSYDPRLEQLETILKGKPEVDIGSVKRPAEPPDWRELKEKSASFLGQSKHLRVALILCCSLLKTSGVIGFADGLRLIRGLLEQFWPTVYPLSDPEDNNDPTQRLNILQALTSPRGSVDGWLTIVDYLYVAPLCQPKGAPPITFDQVQAARQKEKGDSAAANAPDIGKLGKAIQDAGPEAISSSYSALQQALATVQEMDQFLTTTLGAGNTISFEVLEKTVQEMLSETGRFLPGGAPVNDSTEAASAAQGGGIAVSGSIATRDDVVRAIENICEYYRKFEPCSPVPYLLMRAQKLAVMNFVQAVQELNLGTVDSLRPSMGSAVENPPPPETPSS